MFPEDNYGAGVEYQDDGPQPEDKVMISIKTILVKEWRLFLRNLSILVKYFYTFIKMLFARFSPILSQH